MTITAEYIFKNEISYLDKRYLNELERIKRLLEENGKQKTKMFNKVERKILAINGINSGKIRFQAAAKQSSKLNDHA